MRATGIETYADLAKTCGGMVLANEMASRPLEPVSGELLPWDEPLQYYVVQDPSFLIEYTDEVVMRDEELDLYIWLVFHLGTAWDYVPIQGVR